MQRYSTSIMRVCPICQSEYWVEQRRVRKGQGNYCSSTCFGVSRRGISTAHPLRPMLPHPDDPTAFLVPLTKGYYAIIDREDAPLVERYRWHAAERSNAVYAAHKSRGVALYLHRVILGVADDMQVDHEDWNGLNCRRSNLRIATGSQNCAHQRLRPTRSGYRGVWPYKGGRWQVMVKRKFVGIFADAAEAARAYDKVARDVFGEFAVLNFPESGN
jgi:hypothetical protein